MWNADQITLTHTHTYIHIFDGQNLRMTTPLSSVAETTITIWILTLSLTYFPPLPTAYPHWMHFLLILIRVFSICPSSHPIRLSLCGLWAKILRRSRWDAERVCLSHRAVADVWIRGNDGSKYEPISWSTVGISCEQSAQNRMEIHNLKRKREIVSVC